MTARVDIDRGESRQPWLARLFVPIDGAWLAAFRFLFGLMMCASMGRFLAYGWIERFFVTPRVHFKYPGFAWVEPLGHEGMVLLFQALGVLAVCVALGLLFRVTATLFALGLCYVQLIDVSTYLNHYYLAALLALLLAASPAGRVRSVDAWLRQRRLGRDEASAIPFLWLLLFRFQVGVVYFFAGFAKFNSDWLLHAQPLRIWLGTKTDLPILGPLFAVDGVPLAMSWAGFLFDTTIVLWLSFRRTRAAAYGLLLCFHFMTWLLFPIGMFPVIMSVAALVFFPPDWPRTVLRKVFRVKEGVVSSELLPETRGSFRKNVQVCLLALYCTVQLLLPLRALAYGGNVLWHEQGMRFSWRVMLRAKGGDALFVVREPQTNREERVLPRRYLTDLQEAEMVSQPDLLLQMAHIIARDYESRGWEGVEVRVESRVSLNGRRSAQLVDPTVDLSKERAVFAPFPWVTDAPVAPPVHTRPVL